MENSTCASSISIQHVRENGKYSISEQGTDVVTTVFLIGVRSNFVYTIRTPQAIQVNWPFITEGPRLVSPRLVLALLTLHAVISSTY